MMLPIDHFLDQCYRYWCRDVVPGSNLICLFNCYYIIYKNNNDFKRHGAFRIFAKARSDKKRKKPHTLEGENEV